MLSLDGLPATDTDAMTIEVGNTICTLVQSYPILLILAQNHNKCLKTPFIYKPPTPTQSPEYYEALEALFQNLFGHGYHGSEHSSGCGYDGYGKKGGHSTYAYPCYSYGHPQTGHDLSYGHGHHSYPNTKYPVTYGTTYGIKYPGSYGTHSKYPTVYAGPVHHGYPATSYNVYRGYPTYGYKKLSVYNLTGTQGYKGTYAPTQMYNVNNKYKIVVKKNKKRRPHKIQHVKRPFFGVQKQSVGGKTLQVEDVGMASKILVFVSVCLCIKLSVSQSFGYPNQRDNRRYDSQRFRYNQDYPYYYQNNPGNNVQAQPYNNRQNQYVEYYDQYGRIVRPYQQNTGQTPQNWQNCQNWPNCQNQQIYPEQGRNDQIYQNYNQNPNYDAEYVNFPSTNNNNNPGQPAPASDTYEVYVQEQPQPPVNFPGAVQPPPEPVATEPPTTLPPLTPVPTAPLPGFTTTEATTLPPLTPVPQSNYQTESPFSTYETTTLPPLTPVPTSESRNSFDFGPSGYFNEPCELEGLRGSCLPILKCEPFANLLTKAQTDPTIVSLLRKAHCGFEGSSPKVCCPSPRIPDQPPPSPGPATPKPVPTEAPTPVPREESNDASDFVEALPEPPVCGNSSATFSRVVGGIDARLGDFPWMALLGYKNKRAAGASWLCGGSLVTSKHVLTAAHCIHGNENKLFVVRLGELDLESEDDGATPVDVLIKKAMYHEQYNRSSVSNDIGIILLEREVTFTDLIRPICIPTSRELRANTFENYNPMVAGWGHTKFRGPSASILQVIQLPVVSNDFCKQKFTEYKHITIDNRVLCAGYKKGGKDACQGDSGGPLMQPIWNSQDYTTMFYQIGVVSFGKQCAEPGWPGVYSRVTTFVPWIEQKILGPNAKHFE
ncbi:trypsin domain-containing protein [Phthorimaea operculella]|nr:trypsin domain-containing protein [Phthorimaea operculella]